MRLKGMGANREKKNIITVYDPKLKREIAYSDNLLFIIGILMMVVGMVFLWINDEIAKMKSEDLWEVELARVERLYSNYYYFECYDARWDALKSELGIPKEFIDGLGNIR